MAVLTFITLILLNTQINGGNMKVRSTARINVIPGIVLLTGFSICNAQTVTNTVKVDSAVPEIVVTALRSEKDINSVPYTTYRISAEETQIQESKRTTPDVLSGKPSVMVQKTSYGQGSPFLRGFTGFRTLFLVDGIRLNNSVFREGPNQYWNTVDSLSVSDYELVMGPSSVLYGSDAVGGTVNAMPLKTPDYKGSPVWEPRLYYRGSTAERSNIGRVELGGRVNGNIGFIGGFNYKDFGDLRGGKDVGVQEHTGYSETDFDARLDYYIDKDSLFTIAHQTVDQDDAWRTHKTIYGIDWEGLTKGDDKVHSFDQNRDLTYIKYRGNNLNGFVNSIEATLSRQFQGENQYRVKKDSAGERQGFDVETWGSTLQLESDTVAGQWVYGFEYYHDFVDSYNRTYKTDGSLNKTAIQGPVADDASYDSLGIYLQDTIRLLDGKLDITPGIRYTFCTADANKVKDPVTGRQMSVNGDWDAVVGSLRVLHPLTENRNHVLFAGISQGFRAPNLSDLTRLDIARSGEMETPVSNLEPERYLAYEAGIKSRFDKLTTALTYYYTAIDSMVVRAPTGLFIDGNAEVTKKNSGDGYIHGVELSGNYDVTRTLSTRLTACWMDGKVDTYPTSSAEKDKDHISRLMPPSTEIGIRWQTENSKYWVEAICDLAAKADKLSVEDERDIQRIPPNGTPGYAVYTARAGSKITDNLALTVAVENILDEDYRIHGSGVNEPGRNFVLTANYLF
jgi:hemoglobin/transferrin/lactoferrin receptor protein